MPGKKSASARTRGTTLRGLGFAVAIALGAVAVWLVVTGTTQKRIELGVLAGLWGLLLGTFAMFGARRLPPHPDEPQPGDSHPIDPELQARQLDELAAHREALTAEIELRSSAGLERAADAEQRKAFESGLQAMLQREVGEIRQAVSGEVASLRAEVAALRAEILEKVGGQLRLERIETTRVIGSDLEALQHEVRALKIASFTDDPVPRWDPAPEPRRTVVETARVRPVSRESAQVEADVQPAVAPPTFSTSPTLAETPAPAPAPPAPPAPAPAAVPTPAPASAAAPTPVPSPVPLPDSDPLASMPRITPFTAFELDPIDSDEIDDDYSGRRRQRDARHVDDAPARSRHSREAAPAPGGRRRRAADPDPPAPHDPAPDSSVGAARASLGVARHGAGRHTDPDATDHHTNGNHANGNRHEADDYDGGVDLLSRLLSRDSSH